MAKTLFEGKWVETEDCTPTWSGVVATYIAVLENKNASFQGREAALKELYTMARIADKYNQLIEKAKKANINLDELLGYD